MPLFNLAWSPSYAWDGSKPRVRDQALAAMANPLEMHGEPAAVVAILAKEVTMRDAFAAAFGSREITAERVGLALEQYLLTLVAADSKFDRAMRGAAVPCCSPGIRPIASCVMASRIRQCALLAISRPRLMVPARA